MSTLDPKHVEIAGKLQAAFREILPPEFKVCCMIVDTRTGQPPFPMFVSRSIPTEIAKEIAGAFADGKASVTARIVEAEPMLYGRPLSAATDDEVRQAFDHARKCLDNITIPDEVIAGNWRDMLSVLGGEMRRRGLGQ